MDTSFKKINFKKNQSMDRFVSIQIWSAQTEPKQIGPFKPAIEMY